MSQIAVAQSQQQQHQARIDHSAEGDAIGLEEANEIILRDCSQRPVRSTFIVAGEKRGANHISEANLKRPQSSCLATYKAKVNSDERGVCAARAPSSFSTSDNNNNNDLTSGKNNNLTETLKLSPVITGKPSIGRNSNNASKLIATNSLESIESKFSNDFEDVNNNSGSNNNTTTTSSSDIIIDKIALSSMAGPVKTASGSSSSSPESTGSRNNYPDERPQTPRHTSCVPHLSMSERAPRSLRSHRDHINDDRCNKKQTFYEVELGSSQPQQSRANNNKHLFSQLNEAFPLDGPMKGSSNAISDGCDDSNNGKQPQDHNVGFASTGEDAGSQRRSSTKSMAPRFKNEKPPFKFAGIVVSIIGSFCFSLSALCIKLLPQNSPDGMQEKMRAVATRGLLIMFLCGGTLYLQKSTIRVRRDELWINILRAIFGCMGIIGSYVSLCYISLGDSSALIFSSPVWTSLLSYFILGEPLHWILVLALPASLVGIILIAHPELILNLFVNKQLQHQLDTNTDKSLLAQVHANLTSNIESSALHSLQANGSRIHLPEDDGDPNRWIGIGIALATSLCVSGAYIVLKFRKSTKIQTTTFWLGVSSCITGLIAMLFTGFGEIPTSTEALLLLANGIFAWLGQTCMQWGLFYECASILSVVRTSDVAISFALSAMFLDEDIYWTSVLGAAIIAFVVVLMVLNNWFKTKSLASNDSTSDCNDGNKTTEANSEKQQHSDGRRNDIYTLSDDIKVAAA